MALHTALSVTLAEPSRGRSDRWVAGLMNQQCWCWGCDVKHVPDVSAEGNLLMRFGCRRCRPGPGRQGCTCYVHEADASTRLWLWGFGVALETGGQAIFVSRFDARPRRIPPQRVHELHTCHEAVAFDDLSPAPGRARGLACRLWQWVAGYERWVARQAGPSYRKQCLASWAHKPVVPASRMAEAWGGLARETATLAGGWPGRV